MSDPQISAEADALIIREEIGGEKLYRRKYERPEWPGVQSGVTIGIGYDVGAGATPAILWRDWKGRISDDMIRALEPCCGVTGPRARDLTRQLRDKVLVPWEAAIAVYRECTVPRYAGMVRRALPNTGKLHPHCFGALTSLVFNRGASFGLAGDRYREMRAIKVHMQAERFDLIPAEIRSMARLWKEKGLRDRRHREAALFEQGLRTRPAYLYSDNSKNDATRWEAAGLQARLAELGYWPGAADGNIATATAGALAMFQRDNALAVTGLYDDETRAALQTAQPRVVSEGRASATAEDLRENGSQTIATADRLGGPFKWLLALGGAKGAEQTGALDAAKEIVDQASTARMVLDQATDLAGWLLQYWWVAALAIGVMIWINRDRIIARRVDDHRSGKHMGR